MNNKNLLLNDVLHLTPEEIGGSKIVLGIKNGGTREPIIDEWLRFDDARKRSGENADCVYWGWYGNKRNFQPGNIAFAFIRINETEWLFISAAEIIKVPENAVAEKRILEKYAPLFGRLIVSYRKGNKYSRYVFRMEPIIDDLVVKEILPSLYGGDVFEGYDRVNISYQKLVDILEGRIMPTYYEALSKVSGVYCLTDTRTGKLYIGSATGVGGVAERWLGYLKTGHGGDKEFIKLYKEDPEYFKKNFTFTLLEYFGLSYDPQKIIEREQYWKECLCTRKHGYNDN